MRAISELRSKRASAVEFLLLGGATVLLFPLGWLAREALGLSTAELIVGFTAFHGAHLINDPHFSATYLLFYERAKERAFGDAFSRSQRVRYWFSGALVPLVLGTWAIYAISNQSAASLGLMMELMFILVGWHYVKQGFGVFAVLCARRAVHLSQIERRILLSHCIAGWAYAWMSPSGASREVMEKGVVYWTLPRPMALEQLALAAFALTGIAAVWALVQLWRRTQRHPPLAALSGLLVSVWCWTVFSAADPLLVYLIPALHSLQYLYFVRLLQRNKAEEGEGPPQFGRPASHQLARFAAVSLVLGWVLFHGLPRSLDQVLVLQTATSPIGNTPYFAAIFAVVNIHHYFMDAVIWRRENPETRYLMMGRAELGRNQAGLGPRAERQCGLQAGPRGDSLPAAWGSASDPHDGLAG